LDFEYGQALPIELDGDLFPYLSDAFEEHQYSFPLPIRE
jgi:hypothetical protein